MSKPLISAVVMWTALAAVGMGEAPPAGAGLWSLRPVHVPQVPTVHDPGWAKTDIDRFILAALDARGLQPGPIADRRALIRRAYFDLLGLPPATQDVERFIHDTAPDAFARVVDGLLASPRFGERWGRHWLDVARFAESVGGGRTRIFDQAWRYRDYVIASFNADKPYGQFLTEQLAGDLLPYDSPDQGGAQLIATTFLTLGPKNLDDQDKEQLDLDIADEQLDTLGQAVLGLTLGCARCHDHKFDPVPMRDYYAMAGIFTSTQVVEHANVSEYLELELPVEPDHRRALDAHAAAVRSLEQQLDAAQKKLAAIDRDKGASASPSGDAPKHAEERKETEDRLAGLKQSLKQLRAGAPPPAPLAMAVRDAPRPTDLQLRIRGEVHNYGPPVPRGFLSCVPLAEAPSIEPATSGRLQLARWLTAPDHPLTARVIVNRIWAHLLGQGLVRTVDNFGARGERPSHPELLDHLAHQFTVEGGSVKTTVRRIMLSAVYQLDSRHDPVAHAADPENRLLWRAHRRRLDAEALRDAVLALSDALDLTMGGSTIARPIESEFNYHVRHDSLRRSIYLPVFRNSLPDVLEVFDVADPNLVCGRRNTSTLPTQALWMMNSPFAMDQARMMAQRILRRDLRVPRRVALAYMLALSRPPTGDELELATDYLSEQSAAGLDAVEAWADFCQALMASVEFRYLR